MSIDLKESLKKFDTINIYSDLEPATEDYFKKEEEYFQELRDTLLLFIKPLQEIESKRQSIDDKYRKGEYISFPLRYSDFNYKKVKEKIIEISFWFIRLIITYYSKKMNYEVNESEVFNKLNIVEKERYSSNGFNKEEIEEFNKERHEKNKRLFDNAITYKEVITAIHDSFEGLTVDEIKIQKTIERYKNHHYGVTYMVDKIQFKDCFSRSSGYNGFKKQERFENTIKMLSYHFSGSFDTLPCFKILELASPQEQYCLKQIPLEHEKIVSCRYLKTGVFEVTFIDAETAEEFYIKFCTH